MASTVVVFDFDKTIIDCDSDNWVIDDLGGTARFEDLLLSLPWNTAMDAMMGELHAQGRTSDEIAASLRRAPMSPHTVAAIKSASDLGCELRIVSDANRFFIETILDHHGILGRFSEIHTNHGGVDGDGRLRISPYHEFGAGAAGHGCPRCPPNMCKGKIIETMQAAAEDGGTKRFVYLGDGKGDFCPSTKFCDSDLVMPRKGFPVWDLIVENRGMIKAEVKDWSDAEEQKRVLLGHLDGLIAADLAAAAAAAVTGQQFELRELAAIPAVAATAHGVAPKPLRVRN